MPLGPSISSLATVPVEQCQLNCSGHGRCMAHLASPQFPAICLCEQFWMGHSCASRRVNPYRVKSFGMTAPKWPELADKVRLTKMGDAWFSSAGVSCGGGDHAPSCAQCLDHRRSHQCAGECVMQGTKCVAARDVRDVDDYQTKRQAPLRASNVRGPRPRADRSQARGAGSWGRQLAAATHDSEPLALPPLPPNAVYATLDHSPRFLQSSPFFRAFVCSFVANVPSARLYLFTHPPESTALLSAHVVHPRVELLRLEVDLERRAGALQHSRYTAYLNHLRALMASSAGRPERVLLVDATDVIFQSDPFAYLAAAEARGEREHLYFTEESRKDTIGQQPANALWVRQQPANALWVRQLSGARVLERTQKAPGRCSGFTMGHAHPIELYLLALRERMGRLRQAGRIESLTRRYGRDESRGFDHVVLDQGVHNELNTARSSDSRGDSRGERLNLGLAGLNLSTRVLALLGGPVLHGNGARAGRHFGYQHATFWTVGSQRLMTLGQGGQRPSSDKGGGAVGAAASNPLAEVSDPVAAAVSDPLASSGGVATGLPFAMVHQYGKLRPKSLQARMRRELTCREAASQPRYCGGLCSDPAWRAWLGAMQAWNRTAGAGDR